MDGKHTAGARLAANVARLFDNAEEKVGYAFWGYLAMGVVKKDLKLPEVECVINDLHLQRAIALLEGDGHPNCTDRESCKEFTEVREIVQDDGSIRIFRNNPVSFTHFHCEDGLVLHIVPQCRMLPWMDPIPEGPVDADDPDLILTTDPTLPNAREDGPSGPWIGLEPVKILNANSFTESILWLMCRDLQHKDSLMYEWRTMMAYMFDTRRFTRRLSPEFQPAWDCLQRQGDYSDKKVPPFHELILLRQRLIARGSLPDHLPKIDVNQTWVPQLCDAWSRLW